ncbi:Protein FAM135B [Zea mays]|uniref:Protein FAM135B n=1 Tax=Zea mays TaxID=4577 RepID=A0A3L6FYN4_MAIZE|nr:Protein FAM135B [Zea mays]
MATPYAKWTTILNICSAVGAIGTVFGEMRALQPIPGGVCQGHKDDCDLLHTSRQMLLGLSMHLEHITIRLVEFWRWNLGSDLDPLQVKEFMEIHSLNYNGDTFCLVFTRYGLQKLFGLDCLALTSDKSPLYPDLPSNMVDTKRSTTILSGIQLDFLGCLSTMSTFDAEVYTIRRSGQIARAFIYAASTFMLSFLLAQLSSWIWLRMLLNKKILLCYLNYKESLSYPKVVLGHHLDLRLVRNQWLLLDPGADCLMSEANEDKTSRDFKEMGSRLAREVIAFLKKKMDKLSRYGGCKELKLSFVGHSIGNIIIRSALAEPALQPYLKNLYTYMSISGPHLGYWYSSNSLFNSGLWLLKKLKNAQCIHQLTFSDDQDPHNTYFYKLCKLKTLENFKNIILLSSPQDGYVPYHSARMELCPAASSDTSKKGQVFTEMLNNCLDQIRAPSSDTRTFMRCDVNFDQSNHGQSLNTMIGRAAHIEFLETDIYAKFIM